MSGERVGMDGWVVRRFALDGSDGLKWRADINVGPRWTACTRVSYLTYLLTVLWCLLVAIFLGPSPLGNPPELAFTSPWPSCQHMARAGAARREKRQAKRVLARAERGSQKYRDQKGGGIQKSLRPPRNKHGKGRGRRFDEDGPAPEEADEDADVREAASMHTPGTL